MLGRVIVGGLSPYRNHLPVSLFETGRVIGINQWPKWWPCNYWIALDTEQIFTPAPGWEGFADTTLRTMQAVRFLRRRNPGTDPHIVIPEDAADYWVSHAPIGSIPVSLDGWNQTLHWRSSTATAAIHLALLLGASEVVLAGVDFIGSQKCDGSHGGVDWAHHVDDMNDFLQLMTGLFNRPIYKTNPDSPLALPMLPELLG